MNAFPPRDRPLDVDQATADSFDEESYLQIYPDVRLAIDERRYESGLEHYIKNGKSEGRAISVLENSGNLDAIKRARSNAVRGLIECHEGRSVVSANPADLIIVVTTICNLSCVMCPHGMKEVDGPRHTPDWVIDKTLPQVTAASRLILSGIGEPLLAPGFWKVILAAGRNGRGMVRVHSNGHFLSDDNITKLINSGLNWVMFSLDAAEPETYRKIRGGDLVRVRSNIFRLAAARRKYKVNHLKLSVTMTLMAANIDEAAKFVESAHGLDEPKGSRIDS